MRSLLVCLALAAAGGAWANAWADIKLPPAAKNTVYKCEVNGRVHYSDTPCPGAVEVDVTPTRGVHSMSGTKRINLAVEREITQERLAAALPQQSAALVPTAQQVRLPMPTTQNPNHAQTQKPAHLNLGAAGLGGAVLATLAQALQPVWWLLPIVLGLLVLSVVLSAALKSPTYKGQCGERIVKKLLAQRAQAAQEVHLHNVTLNRLDKQGSAQIDHIVINRYGIFVLETKHYKGLIVGREHDSQWRQVLGKKQIPFQNPLHQNHGHIKALEELLQLPSSVFQSVIVFTNAERLASHLPQHVCTHHDLLQVLAALEASKNTVFTREQVQSIHSQLQLLRLPPTHATHRTHVHNVQSRRKNFEHT